MEDGLTRAFPGAFISCRFTTCRAKDTRALARKKGYEQFSVDDERSSTQITIGAESLLIARQLSVTVPFGVDEQLPVSLAFCLPIPPQQQLSLMVESRVTPPLRARPQRTFFLSDRVLLGHLPAGWITRHLDDVNEVTTELLRREIVTMCHGVLETKNVQFVGRRENGKGRSRGPRDRSPLFLYLDFPGVEEARASFSSILARWHNSGLEYRIP